MVEPRDMSVMQGRRKSIATFVEGKGFVWTITLLIFFNSVTLGLETNSLMVERYGSLLFAIDKVILLIFSLEIFLKLYAYRLQFFRSGWNIFDLSIVSIAWVPAIGPFSILRAFRVLRLFRLLSVVPQMRRVVGALLHAIPGMLSVSGILSLIFYICAVLTTSLFGSHPDPQMQEWFGSISSSLYTLFQVMTLESWSMGIVRPTMEIFPLSWIFFLPFIIITSFAVLNLFIGIIVDAMQTAQTDPRENDLKEIKEFTHLELADFDNRFNRLHREIKLLQDLMIQQSEGRRSS